VFSAFVWKGLCPRPCFPSVCVTGTTLSHRWLQQWALSCSEGTEMSYAKTLFSIFFLSTFRSRYKMWTSYSQHFIFMFFMFPILSRTVPWCFPSFSFFCSFSSATLPHVFGTLIPVDAWGNVCQVSRFQRRAQRWTAIWVAARRLITRHNALLRRIGWLHIRAVENEMKEQPTLSQGFVITLDCCWNWLCWELDILVHSMGTEGFWN
jgi:hypothetical protein